MVRKLYKIFKKISKIFKKLSKKSKKLQKNVKKCENFAIFLKFYIFFQNFIKFLFFGENRKKCVLTQLNFYKNLISIDETL